MGKTLKYGSHDFPAAAGFTGSSGQGPIPVRGHSRTRVRRMQGVPMPDPLPDSPAAGPSGVAGTAELKEGGKWIAGAIKHPGALHRELKVPQGEKIPAKKLARAANSDNPTLAKRAQLAETLKSMHHARGGKIGALQRYAEGGAVQPQLPVPEQIKRAGRPGQDLLPGYKGGGKPRNFDQGGVVADQGTTAALDTRLKNLAATTGMALAPLSAQQQQQQVVGHGTGAYQGSPATTVGGVTVQPERETQVYSQGRAPFTAAALGAALNNAVGLVTDPLMMGARTLASNLAGVPAGGLQSIPGYHGPYPDIADQVAAGKLTSAQANALSASRDMRDDPLGHGYGVGPEGHWSGHDATSSGGIGSGTGATGGGQGERAGFRRGREVKGGRKR